MFRRKRILQALFGQVNYDDFAIARGGGVIDRIGKYQQLLDKVSGNVFVGVAGAQSLIQ